MKQLLLDLSAQHPPSLDAFVVGRNAELLAQLRQALVAPAERCIYLWGEAGCGKSHLLRAFGAEATRRGRRVLYLSVTQAEQLSADLETYHVVAIDDVEQLDHAAQVRLFDLYNRMRDGQGLLLVAGSQAPTHLHLRADLVTRLGWGLVYHLHALSDAEKADALVQHARSRGFELPREVSDYLLRHARRDLPSLLALLDALDRYSMETKRDITVPLLRELMQPDLLSSSQ